MSKLIRKYEKIRILLLSGPNVFFLILFFLAPIAIMLAYSIYPEGILSGENYVEFFSKSYFTGNFIKTLTIAAIVTVSTLIIGYPVAYYVSKSRRFQGFLMFVLFFPILISTVIQSFGWMVILGRTGLINTFLMNLGLIGKPLPLLYNVNGIIIGLIQHLLPYMIMPLIASLVSMDPSLIEASKNLGAGRIRTFFSVILPLSLPGIFAGASIVLTASIAMFVIPSLLGGAEKVMSVMVADHILFFGDWAMASTISFIMIVTTLITIFIFSQLITRTKYGRGAFR